MDKREQLGMAKFELNNTLTVLEDLVDTFGSELDSSMSESAHLETALDNMIDSVVKLLEKHSKRYNVVGLPTAHLKDYSRPEGVPIIMNHLRGPMELDDAESFLEMMKDSQKGRPEGFEYYKFYIREA